MVKKILVVEDNEELRMLMEIALESEGFRVESAPNGLEALNLLKEASAPDLILLDLMMPVMSGQEFIESRKQLPELNEIPLLVFSAAAENVPKGFPFLRKPVDLHHLLSEVQSLIAS
ncbi:MAG TPA: response regulator [Bdellovibrionota bacterium]|jgi:sigma-B regulation protein RsbU (phosphoserine phosphatase)|nr:response regulator [Bdellovibrionota bacterium]